MAAGRAEVATALASAQREIERLQERLEIAHAYDMAGNKVPFPAGSPYDGIEGRDETIPQQDQQIATLKARVRELEDGLFSIGTRVRKIRGSSWQGRVCGSYSTSLTPFGVCVESEREPGSVQIYPVSALEIVTEEGSDGR